MTEIKKELLWLNFVLESMNYCILSEHIKSIMIPGIIEPMPNSPKAVVGITKSGKETICVIGLREVFGKLSLQKCVEDFGIMKDMHVSWIEDLKRYVHEGGEFTKAVDPHKCKFGIWYDNFYTDNSRLNRLLKKIEVPHENIHRCGAEIKSLRNQLGDHQEEIEDLLGQAESICYDEIVPLLDRLIDVYSLANRGVLIIVNNGETPVGFLVDQVKSLIPCEKAEKREFTGYVECGESLGGIVLEGKNIMLEINVEQILKLLSNETLLKTSSK